MLCCAYCVVGVRGEVHLVRVLRKLCCTGHRCRVVCVGGIKSVRECVRNGCRVGSLCVLYVARGRVLVCIRVYEGFRVCVC